MLLSLLIVVAVCSSPCWAIKCYTCNSIINATNVESGTGSCARLSEVTSTADHGYCTFTVRAIGGTFSIERGGFPGTASGGCDSTTCYCNTDECNSEPLFAPVLTCYQCNSVDFIDNGCGENFNPQSKYVQQVQRCSACVKTVSQQGTEYGKRYTRGCTRSVYTDNTCTSGDSVYKTCTCKTSTCNHASRPAHFSALFLTVVLSTIYI